MQAPSPPDPSAPDARVAAPALMASAIPLMAVAAPRDAAMGAGGAGVPALHGARLQSRSTFSLYPSGNSGSYTTNNNASSKASLHADAGYAPSATSSPPRADSHSHFGSRQLKAVSRRFGFHDKDPGMQGYVSGPAPPSSFHLPGAGGRHRSLSQPLNPSELHPLPSSPVLRPQPHPGKENVAFPDQPLQPEQPGQPGSSSNEPLVATKRNSADRVIAHAQEANQSVHQALYSFQLLEALKGNNSSALKTAVSAAPSSWPVQELTSPLHLAVRSAEIEVVKHVLDLRPGDLNAPDAVAGNTALHVSSALGRAEIVAMLLDRPLIDVTARNKAGQTASELAASPDVGQEFWRVYLSVQNEAQQKAYVYVSRPQDAKARSQLLHLLARPISQDLDLDQPVQTGQGGTLLHVAAARGDAGMVKAVAKAGGNVYIRDASGRSPGDVASSASLRALLQQLGSARRFVTASTYMEPHDNQLPSSKNVKSSHSQGPGSEPGSMAPICRGYLGKYYGFPSRRFKTRWFVLSHGVLAFYHDHADEPQPGQEASRPVSSSTASGFFDGNGETGAHSAGLVELISAKSSGCVDVRTAHILADPVDGTRFHIRGVHPLRHSAVRIVVRCTHASDRMRWVHAMRQAQAADPVPLDASYGQGSMSVHTSPSKTLHSARRGSQVSINNSPSVSGLNAPNSRLGQVGWTPNEDLGVTNIGDSSPVQSLPPPSLSTRLSAASWSSPRLPLLASAPGFKADGPPRLPGLPKLPPRSSLASHQTSNSHPAAQGKNGWDPSAYFAGSRLPGVSNIATNDTGGEAHGASNYYGRRGSTGLTNPNNRAHDISSSSSPFVSGSGSSSGMNGSAWNSHSSGSEASTRILTPGSNYTQAGEIANSFTPQNHLETSGEKPGAYGGRVDEQAEALSCLSDEAEVAVHKQGGMDPDTMALSRHDSSTSFLPGQEDDIPHARQYPLVASALTTHSALAENLVNGLAHVVSKNRTVQDLAPIAGQQSRDAKSGNSFLFASDTSNKSVSDWPAVVLPIAQALSSDIANLRALITRHLAMTQEREACYAKRYAHEVQARHLWERNLALLAQQYENVESTLRAREAQDAHRRATIRKLHHSLRRVGGGLADVPSLFAPQPPSVGATYQSGAAGGHLEGGKVSQDHALHEFGVLQNGDSDGRTTNETGTPTLNSPSLPTGKMLRPIPAIPDEVLRELQYPDDGISSHEEEFFDAVELGLVKTPTTTAETIKHLPPLDDSSPLKREAVDAFAPYKNLRTCLPMEADERPHISLWSVLKNNIGKDLTKISFPVSFNEPTSMLQRMAEDMEFASCLNRGAQCPDPTLRIAFVAAFAMSNYSSTIGRIAKPFNPLLGETFEFVSVKDQYRYYSEQVSHHPPISACFAESPRWEYFGSVDAQNRFTGRTFEIRPTGMAHAHLKVPQEWVQPATPVSEGSMPAPAAHGPRARIAMTRPNEADATPGEGIPGSNAALEHYTWNKVTTCVSGFLVGKTTIDHYGDMEVVNHHTGDRCILNFKPRGWRGKDAFGITGAVYDVTGTQRWDVAGKWCDKLVARKHGTDHEMDGKDAVVLWTNSTKFPAAFNLPPYAAALNDLPEGLYPWLPPTDSRLRPDLRTFESGLYEVADNLKYELEELQRSRRREVESGARPPHRPRWFERTTDAHSQTTLWRPLFATHFPEPHGDKPELSSSSNSAKGQAMAAYWTERMRSGKLQELRRDTSQVSGQDQGTPWEGVERIFGSHVFEPSKKYA